MADNFGLKIGVEGEKEFKKALAEINQTFKVLGSEMNLVASQFDKQDKSVEALSARNRVLNQEIDTQRQKISTLQQALENATNSFGENDRRTKQWQTQLNNAQATLNEMERELAQNERAIDELGMNWSNPAIRRTILAMSWKVRPRMRITPPLNLIKWAPLSKAWAWLSVRRLWLRVLPLPV